MNDPQLPAVPRKRNGHDLGTTTIVTTERWSGRCPTCRKQIPATDAADAVVVALACCAVAS